MLSNTKATRHRLIAQQTGFAGNFGGGRFQAWIRNSRPDLARTDWTAWAGREINRINALNASATALSGSNGSQFIDPKAKKHALIRQATGFPGVFGSGRFYAWLRQNRPDLAAVDWSGWADLKLKKTVTTAPEQKMILKGSAASNTGTVAQIVAATIAATKASPVAPAKSTIAAAPKKAAVPAVMPSNAAAAAQPAGKSNVALLATVAAVGLSLLK